MATSNQDSTQAEELTKMLSQIAQTKTKPDADLPYLIQLESMILGKLREPFVAAQQQAYGGQPAPGGMPNPVMQGPPGAPGGMPQGGPPGMAGGPPMGMPQGSVASPGGGVNGVQSMASLPPVDEIRRMLSAGKK